MPKKITVAIDGPASSGKSTVAKMLAQRLGYLYIDTGAMYRAIALAVTRRGVDPQDAVAVAAVARQAVLKVEPGTGGMRIALDGQWLGNEIRTPEISRITSRFIANSDAVRDVLVQRQRELGKDGGIVMEGRDISTEVFPGAELKIYLNASVKERARRRIKDFQDRGIAYDEAQVEADIQKRDDEDKGRKRGALRQAPDALEVIADQKSPEEIVLEILSHLPKDQSFIIQKRPCPIGDSMLYSFFRFILVPLFRLLFGYKVTGMEHVPKDGGLILCSNHASFLDPPLVGSCIGKRQIGFFARDSLFRNPVFGWLIRTLHAFPIKRGAVDRAALEAFKCRVAAGAGVLVFPEGTRSLDGQLQKGKAGVGMLIHGCPGATVVPVRVRGSEKAWPKGARFIHRAPISVAFGPALDLGPETGMPARRETYDRITEKVMAAIAAL